MPQVVLGGDNRSCREEYSEIKEKSFHRAFTTYPILRSRNQANDTDKLLRLLKVLDIPMTFGHAPHECIGSHQWASTNNDEDLAISIIFSIAEERRDFADGREASNGPAKS